MIETPPTPSLVPGRSCDGCTLCCKLMGVESLAKPRMTWCVHCDIGVGCRIYQERPEACATFYCTWRLSPQLGEEWRPSLSGMVMSFEPARQRLNISIDSDRGLSWRREPYYSQIKAMAVQLIARRTCVIVWDGLDGVVVLPDKELPIRSADDRVVVRERITPLGPRIEIDVVGPDDPPIGPGA